MAATNDVTGDKIQTKSPSAAYISNYDNIFRKTMKVRVDLDQHMLFYLQDEATLKVLDSDSYYHAIEVPKELVDEYHKVAQDFYDFQDKLRKIYNESFRVDNEVDRAKWRLLQGNENGSTYG